MRGHIARKGNRYYAVVYEGFDPKTGKERHRCYAAGDTRRGAEKVLAEHIKRIHDGDYRAPERITFGDYLVERWLPTRKAQLRPSTYSSYRNDLELHVIPRIGHIPLQKLQPEDIDTLYADLLTNGKRNGNGGGLSPKSVRNIHGIIRKALADAMRKGSVTRNVADLADPPRARARKMDAWTADELRQFLTSIEDSEWYVPIYLAANTGMRRGEVLGLTWRNVDLDNAHLVVEQQVQSVEYEASVADVKTAGSRRTIDLDPRTVTVLKAWRRQQIERHLSTGRRTDDEFVFTHTDGGSVHPDLFSQSWSRLMDKSEVRRIRLHDLRHTHASILLKAGVPVKVVSERLGHSGPAFTMTVYQHVLPGMQADAARPYGDAVFGGTHTAQTGKNP
jgi:integrase